MTIHWHLARRHEAVPSVSTIWRVLTRRGFVTPQPKKRPRSSFVRFEADLPNERWQSLRYDSRLHHIGVGRAHVGKRILLLVADLDVRIVDEDGELLRQLTIDPGRDYQPLGST